MNSLIQSCWTLFLMIALASLSHANEPDDQVRIAELDAYWAGASKTVVEGDFEGYSATLHPDAVIVDGITQKNSHPAAAFLADWKSGFELTKAGEEKASVEFRFSQRIGDETTAHETGIFLYKNTDQAGKATAAYIHFESLLVKRDGKWLTMMEYQKSKATLEQWKALAK